jgi:hypothetical protein
LSALPHCFSVREPLYFSFLTLYEIPAISRESLTLEEYLCV